MKETVAANMLSTASDDDYQICHDAEVMLMIITVNGTVLICFSSLSTKLKCFYDTSQYSPIHTHTHSHTNSKVAPLQSASLLIRRSYTQSHTDGTAFRSNLGFSNQGWKEY